MPDAEALHRRPERISAAFVGLQCQKTPSSLGYSWHCAAQEMNKFDDMMAYLKQFHKQNGQAMLGRFLQDRWFLTAEGLGFIKEIA